MSDSATPIIIIKRKKGGHGAPHGGAWKVAYADFVTAMMALFIVLWIVNTSQSVRMAVSGYFNDPRGYGKETGNTRPGTGRTVDISTMSMKEIQQKLAEAMQRVPELKQLKDQIEMTITSEGLRIELLETEKGVFFESGSSRPSQFGEELLTLLAKEIARLPNRILIEGHTDSRPYASRTDYGNWELSADRANAARRLMQTNGLRTDQVSAVRGYADQRLRKPLDPANASNRRISVTVQYLEKASDAKAAPAPPLLSRGQTVRMIKNGTGAAQALAPLKPTHRP